MKHVYQISTELLIYIKPKTNNIKKTKSKKSKVLYSDSSGVKKLDIPVLGERNNIGLQTDILISLMGANFSYKRKSNDAGF